MMAQSGKLVAPASYHIHTLTGGRQGRQKISSSSVKAQGSRRDIILTWVIAAAQVDDSRTLLLNKYLKKSEENKDKNDKERLENYYKRNYRDYFGLLEGTLKQKSEQQLSEAEKGILQWLETNK